MYADEGPYTINVRHVEAMVGRLEKRWMATESGGDETATRPGTRPAVSETRPTTATAGDKRDGGDWWDNVYGRRGVRI